MCHVGGVVVGRVGIGMRGGRIGIALWCLAFVCCVMVVMVGCGFGAVGLSSSFDESVSCSGGRIGSW